MNDAPASARIRHALILAHPAAHSFDAAIAHAYCEAVTGCGQEVVVRDLYAMGFDPVLRDSERPRGAGIALSPDVQAEIDTIGDAEMFVLVYPIWFAMPPAMLKGYIDRVLGAGATPRQIQQRTADGVLTGRHMISITTSGTREAWLDEQGQIEALRSLSTRYLRNAYAMASCEHLHFGGIVEDLSERFADQYLYDVHERARRLCAMLAAERRTGAPPFSIGDGS